MPSTRSNAVKEDNTPREDNTPMMDKTPMQHSTSEVPVISDEWISKICEKMKNILFPVIEDIIESKSAAIISTVNEIKAMIQDNNQRNKDVSKRLDALEQYSRRNNLRIFGVKEVQNENTDALVLTLFQQNLNLNLSLRDIDRSHRVGRLSNGSVKPRGIIVKFVSYRYRQEVFSRKKMFKNTHYMIREDLTKHRHDILQDAIKKYGSTNVWTSDGRIVINHNNRKFYVSSKEEFPN